ncbi:MAG: hypothetical protein ACNS62_14300 [Candidatus Cyclobacteriaceae bacterium M3_2C_046]
MDYKKVIWTGEEIRFLHWVRVYMMDPEELTWPRDKLSLAKYVIKHYPAHTLQLNRKGKSHYQSIQKKLLNSGKAIQNK